MPQMMSQVEMLEHIKQTQTQTSLVSEVRAIEERYEFKVAPFSFKAMFYSIAGDHFTLLWNQEHSHA